MKAFAGILTLFLIAVAGYGTAQADDNTVVVRDAWIREAPPNAMSLAGYMTMENVSNTDLSLVNASTDLFGHVMIHQTMHKDGMASMHHQNEVSVPAKKIVRFEPNGYHLMLMHPGQALKSGDQVPITLDFSNGSKLDIVFEVRTGMPTK